MSQMGAALETLRLLIPLLLFQICFWHIPYILSGIRVGHLDIKDAGLAMSPEAVHTFFPLALFWASGVLLVRPHHYPSLTIPYSLIGSYTL